jgi:uncharacterized Tic20 family protein
MEKKYQPTSDERIWTALAHGSTLLFIFGPLASLLIWSTQRKKSSYVAFQALQALGYQLIAHCIMILLNILVSLLGVAVLVIIMQVVEDSTSNSFGLVFGMQFFLFASLFGVVGLYYLGGVIAAIFSLVGRDFRYPILGNWLARYLNYIPTLTGEEPAAELAEEQEDRWVAAMGHAGLFFQIWGMFLPLLTWVLHKDRSRILRFQSLQTLIYQGLGAVVYFGAMGLYMASFFLVFFPMLVTGTGSSDELTGIGMIILLVVAVLVMLVYMVGGPIYALLGIIATIRVAGGHDFRYPLLGHILASRLDATSTPAPVI